MNRFEKRKVAIDKSIRGHIEAYKAIYKKAEDEDRDPSDDERLDIESELKSIETLKAEREDVEANIKTLQGVDDTLRELGPSVSVTSEPQDRMFEQLNKQVFPQAQKSIGQLFVESKGYSEMKRFVTESGSLPGNYSTGKMEFKGTLLEGDGAPGDGSGGGAIPVPQVIPGVTEKLFQRLTLADLLSSGVTDSSTLRSISEGTATNGAAGVAEAGAKPESTLGLGTQDENVRKIATALTISDEMLEDAPFIQAYINQRLVLFVRIEEERQLVRGSTEANEVLGLLNRSVPVYTAGTGDTYSLQIFKAANSMRGSAHLEPEWLVIHPSDWETIRTAVDANKQYYGGGPFQGQYGAGAMVGESNQVTGANDYVWGLPTYVTTALGNKGTALVGTRANACVWRRGGISVEASNSHGDNFLNNLVALRAEERLALAVYRNAGYVELHFAGSAGG